MNPKVENLKGKLIVSCQALPDEPLHSSFIMGRMALAAKQGGASGIRANTPEDIKEIKTQVDLPVIGIIKRNYDDCEIYITPTIKEIDELMEAKPEIIALDATISSRPKGQKLDEFFHEIKENYPKKNIWCYTGYTYDKDLLEGGKVYTPFTEEMLSYIDTLVDGQFIESQKDITLKFRGSANQRILDLNEK